MDNTSAGNLPPLRFIVFSDDWGVHPSSSQHIFRQIANNYEVAWINTVGMRRPTFSKSDIQKAVRKLFNMARMSSSRDTQDANLSISVYQPLMIPFNDIRFIRRINKRLVERTVRKIAKKWGKAEPTMVTTAPNACDYIDSVPSRKIVYYCVDDFSEWPGLDKNLILEMESELIRKSDLFVATSRALFERLAKSGKPTFSLPHGVDVELFSTDPPREHPLLAKIPKPRVGYFGLFDGRSDQELIGEVAEKMPDVSFVIAGRVETPTPRLDRIENVYFTGPIPYTELPELIKGIDLLFIAYVVNALSDALSPLKFKEYLATGRPVICTPIAAASEFSRFIHVSSEASEWQSLIRAALDDNDAVRREDASDLLAGESWRDKAKQFVDYCCLD